VGLLSPEERAEWESLMSRIGYVEIEQYIEWAMDKAQVKKSRRPHVARVCRFLLGYIRSNFEKGE
jgi:hypothetical protein